jgi:hypothetical protein
VNHCEPLLREVPETGFHGTFVKSGHLHFTLHSGKGGQLAYLCWRGPVRRGTQLGPTTAKRKALRGATARSI